MDRFTVIGWKTPKKIFISIFLLLIIGMFRECQAQLTLKTTWSRSYCWVVARYLLILLGYLGGKNTFLQIFQHYVSFLKKIFYLLTATVKRVYPLHKNQFPVIGGKTPKKMYIIIFLGFDDPNVWRLPCSVHITDNLNQVVW